MSKEISRETLLEQFTESLELVKDNGQWHAETPHGRQPVKISVEGVSFNPVVFCKNPDDGKIWAAPISQSFLEEHVYPVERKAKMWSDNSE